MATTLHARATVSLSVQEVVPDLRCHSTRRGDTRWGEPATRNRCTHAMAYARLALQVDAVAGTRQNHFLPVSTDSICQGVLGPLFAMYQGNPCEPTSFGSAGDKGL